MFVFVFFHVFPNYPCVLSHKRGFLFPASNIDYSHYVFEKFSLRVREDQIRFFGSPTSLEEDWKMSTWPLHKQFNEMPLGQEIGPTLQCLLNISLLDWAETFVSFVWSKTSLRRSLCFGPFSKLLCFFSRWLKRCNFPVTETAANRFACFCSLYNIITTSCKIKIDKLHTYRP